jgi:hypothetical protein
MRYANSVMTTYYDGYDGAEEEPCVVVIRDKEMVIEYRRKGGHSIYRGELEGERYHLHHVSEIEGFAAEAYLTQPEDNLLDGTWSELENGSRVTGTWDIELKE